MRTVRTVFVAHDLAKLITSCKCAYGVGADSIGDEDYDLLEAMLYRLCPDHPILRVVGTPSPDYKNPSIQEVMKLMNIKIE